MGGCEPGEDFDPVRDPVTKHEAPKYFEIVKNPMDLSTVQERLEVLTINTPPKLYNDIMLICHNALLFNVVASDV